MNASERIPRAERFSEEEIEAREPEASEPLDKASDDEDADDCFLEAGSASEISRDDFFLEAGSSSKNAGNVTALFGIGG